MKDTIKLSVMILMAGILIFSPLVAFAQEEGEVAGKETLTQSPEGMAGPSSDDPTSSPLSEAYGQSVSAYMPNKADKLKKSKPPKPPKSN